MNRQDTPFTEIREQKDINISGLYYLDRDAELIDGRYRPTKEPVKATPSRLYFGSDLSDWENRKDCPGGQAYTHIYSGLYPVYKANGERLIIDNLRNVCARYDGKKIYDFYRD